MGRRVALLALLAATLTGGCAVGALPPQQGDAPSDGPAVPVNHCLGNTAPQRILVSIAAQHAWLCAGRRTVFDTGVTTGMADPRTATPVGDFSVQAKATDTTLSPATGGSYPVRYWIPFDAPAYGFHDASWQHFPYGSPQYRTSGSHGCVHLPLAAMRVLYDWVHVGAAVTIQA